jgi:hypothetical protein
MTGEEITKNRDISLILYPQRETPPAHIAKRHEDIVIVES